MISLPNAYAGRHPDLAPLLPALAWFYGTLAHGDEPLGQAANDDGDPYPSSVPDRDPKPPKAEEIIAAYMAGALRFATETKRAVQFVRNKDGEYDRRTSRVHAGSITHIWGKRVTQDAATAARPSEAKAAIAARKATLDWFCIKLGAIPPQRLRRTFKRRKVQPPIDWGSFAHVRGEVPIEIARSACGLPPVTACPLPGLPFLPTPSMLFRGMVSGRGGTAGIGQDGEPAETLVRRAKDDDYTAAGFIIDRLALGQFEQSAPEHYATLRDAAGAGSMGELVASNDNATGKRKLVRAAEALQTFLAA